LCSPASSAVRGSSLITEECRLLLLHEWRSTLTLMVPAALRDMMLSAASGIHDQHTSRRGPYGPCMPCSCATVAAVEAVG
jgi:hypothetical protein